MITNVVALQSKLAAETVRAAATARGWTYAQIAERCKLTTESFKVRLSEGLHEIKLRRRLEHIFDYEFSLCSDAQLLSIRRRFFAAHKVDPWTMDKLEIKVLCVDFNVRDWNTAKNTGELLERFAAHLFANPSLLQPKIA